jgi:hypothetical protein
LAAILHSSAIMIRSRASAVLGVAISVLAGCGLGSNQEGPTGTQSVASPLIADEGFWMGIYHPINNVVLAEREGIRLVANGNLALSFAETDFEGTLDANNELDTFRAKVGLDGAMTMEVAVEGSGELDSELPLATIPLPPVPVSGVVTVTPYVQMRLLLRGTAAAAARVSVVAPFHVGAKFSKEGRGRRRTDLSSDPQFTAEVGLPEVSGNFDGTVELEVTTTFLVNIQGFEVGGPVVGTRLGAQLQVALAPQSAWNLEGLVSLVGGWAFLDPTTGLPDVPVDLLEKQFPPKHIADGALPEIGPATRWSRVFDVERDDNAATALLAGEEIVVVESGDEPWLASLNLEGAPSWQSTATDGWTPKAMARPQDGGDLLVAGVSSDGHDMRVERYDPSGTALWRSTLTVSGAEVTFNSILATSGDDTIIAGEVAYDDGTTRPILAALDALGNLIWSKEIETGAGSSKAAIEALAETPSGGILAVGKVDYADAGATIDGTNALILRLDVAGNPAAAYAVGGSHSQVAHHVAMYPDGSYAIGGEQDIFAPHIAWIASLWPDDTLRWSASYQSRPYVDGNGEQARVTALAPLSNHGLLVSGHIGSADIDAFVSRLGETGMPFWSKTYKSADEDKLLAVLAVPDGLVAFGSTGITEEVGSYTDLWMIRGNVDGMVPFAADSGFVVENSAVQWTQVNHSVHPLAPTIVATSTLAGGPAAFTVNAANVVGELLTD